MTIDSLYRAEQFEVPSQQNHLLDLAVNIMPGGGRGKEKGIYRSICMYVCMHADSSSYT